MHYFSTNRKSPNVDFRSAVLNGQPADKGLYFPERIPKIPKIFIDRLCRVTNEQIAFDAIRPYIGEAIPDEILYGICSETVNFPFPLVEISPSISALELFHGPTLAFKDVGARFMSRCLRYFSLEESRKTIVIVATSGDTGGAVANGFHNVDEVEVVILYPKGKVSRVQELQLTTLGGNVITLEVRGNFDDCQRLAKTALADENLKKKVALTSANSINVARWLPQQFYYFYALKQWEAKPPVISVPSGNFGNIAAGLIAHLSGLPARKFIAACNANDVVPEFFLSGEYRPKSSVATLSNAMDVGDPSNFVRILEMLEADPAKLKQTVEAVSVSDETTAKTMLDAYSEFDYVLDPHGAVGYRALADYIGRHPDEKGIFLETAHPVKFDSVEKILGTNGNVPESVSELLLRKKESIEIDVSYEDLKALLTSKI
ncbi:MAG: threonine synthase [Blastocatellia bacterium]